MLVATAGHVDHGKSLLIRQLTGTDTDRLPEEKARGVSIDLGFAYASLKGSDSAEAIGFVDVPGHEKFVRNMLAGVGAIDVALLVIAADDGPMPQTREHLAILNLLGVSTGVIALSKTDLVDRARADEVTEQIRHLIAKTGLAGSAIVPVSGLTGDGIDLLRDELVRLTTDSTDDIQSSQTGGRFRLAIDRQFTVTGAGLIVTGAVFSGSVRTGDTVLLAPQEVPLRVRSMRVQNAAAETGSVGQRCAINLAGPALSSATIQRGDWLIGDDTERDGELTCISTNRIDTLVTVLKSEPSAVKHWTPVHVHLGAASTTGRIAPLEGKTIEPGQQQLAQLVLDEALSPVRGDRFILRDQSARRTIAGGMVIDPYGAVRARTSETRMNWLNAMQGETPRQVLEALLRTHPIGVNTDQFSLSWNLTAKERKALHDTLPIKTIPHRSEPRSITANRWKTLRDAMLDQMQQWHTANPDQSGPEARVLTHSLGQLVDSSFVVAAITELVREGTLIRHGNRLRLHGHQASMSADDQQLWNRVSPHVGPDDLQPPVVSELARRLDVDKDTLAEFLGRSAERGQLTPVAANRFLHPQAVYRLASIAESLGQQDPFDARRFRDSAGIGRNLSIELLEFFDAHRFTRRIGDTRVVLQPAVQVFGIDSVNETATR